MKLSSGLISLFIICFFSSSLSAQQWDDYYKRPSRFILLVITIQHFTIPKSNSQSRKEFGKKDIDYVTSLNYLAGLYDKFGNYKKAESLYFEAIRIIKEIAGDDNLVYTIQLKAWPMCTRTWVIIQRPNHFTRNRFKSAK